MVRDQVEERESLRVGRCVATREDGRGLRWDPGRPPPLAALGERAEQLGPEPVRRHPRGIVRAHSKYRGAARATASRDLVGDPRLADAGLSGQPHGGAATVEGTVEHRARGCETRVPTEQPESVAAGRGDRSGGDRRRPVLLDDGRSEAEPAAAHSDDDLLQLVTQRSPGLENYAPDGRIAHLHAGPQGVQELLPRHQPIPRSHQQQDHIEHPGLDPHGATLPPQLEASRVDLDLTAAVDHLAKSMAHVAAYAHLSFP